MKRWWILSSLLVALAACGPRSKCGPDTAVVDHVIDGDTIVLQDGTKIRYLLVDTPEITLGKNDCWGQEAADFNRAHVEGKTVSLKYDDAECTDRYNRTLAWVSADGLELNAELVKQGYACELYVAPGGQARKEEFLTYEAQAKTDRVGMWGQCTVIPCSR